MFNKIHSFLMIMTTQHQFNAHLGELPKNS